MSLCGASSDGSFGPRVDVGCRAFDFTVFFEDVFFGAGPAALLLLFLPFFGWILLKQRRVAGGSLLLAAKLLAYSSLFAFHIAFLILRTRNLPVTTAASLPADVLQVVAIAGAAELSYLHHGRSVRPSTLLTLALSSWALLDVPRLRTLWMVPGAEHASIVLTIALTLTLITLGLESKDKRDILEAGVAKPDTPEPFAGFWKRASFAWLATTFRRGYTKVISVDDLPELDPQLSSGVVHHELERAWATCDKTRKHALLLACFRAYSGPFLAGVIPRLFFTGFSFAQPFLINVTISFMGDPAADTNFGKGLIGAFALVYLGMAVSTALHWYQTFRFVIRLRGGLISLIYRHTVQTRAVDLGEITAVTLMGTDVERITTGFKSIHELWSSVIDIAIATYLLERQVQIVCFVPILMVVVAVIIILKVSMLSKGSQRAWVEKVEDRLRLTTHLLGDMKAVKMLGLSERMYDLVQGLRKVEIETSRAFRKLLIWQIYVSNTPADLAPVLTFTVYSVIALVRNDSSLLAGQAFTSLSLISLLTSLVLAFIQAIPAVLQCIGSFDRIQEYCSEQSSCTTMVLEPPSSEKNSSEKNSSEKNSSEKNNSEKDISSIGLVPRPLDSIQRTNGDETSIITVRGSSFGWGKDDKAVLEDIDVAIPRNAFTLVLGPVGSGKSTFLETMLGETVSADRQAQVALPTTAYCSQTVWLRGGTIRQNIIGPSEVDETWYKTVVWACGLEPDFLQLPRGDQTPVGSKGLGLSGGQKQRIALARAVYARTAIVLLDDVFSGVDAATTDLIVRRLFGSEGIFRRNKNTVVLATHNATLVPFADSLVVFQNGRIIERGSYDELRNGDGYVARLAVKSSDVAEGAANTSAAGPDVPVTPGADSVTDTELALDLSDPTRQNGNWSVYKYYAKSAGYTAVFSFAAAMVVGAFCHEFPTIWLDWWSAANAKNPNADLGLYLGIYALLSVATLTSLLVACWYCSLRFSRSFLVHSKNGLHQNRFIFITMISNSAIKLHSDLLRATTRAPVQFFQKSDVGSITNRFSQDMDLIDMNLPLQVVNYVVATRAKLTVVAASTCLVKAIILFVFVKYLGVVLPFMVAAIYTTQKFYLRTSRQVRLLDIEAKAPLYTHFLETVQGAAIIRAHGWQETVEAECQSLLDTSQRPVYILSCIQQCLALVLDLLVTVLAVILVSVVTTWRDAFDPGAVGVALIMVMTFNTTLMSLVKFWTTMETSIGAVARVKKFVDTTDSEEPAQIPEPIPREWPESGAVQFSSVVAAYSSGSDPVLKGMTTSVRPGEKLAVCGRSGSGKTSFILALLQMVEVQQGTITIDGINLSRLSPADLRSRLNVVTQDPFLMPGTIRFNLDPFEKVPDEDIIAALRKIGLWDAIEKDEGLDKDMTAESWSVGQRQLLCLARAMLRKSRILVLDEATSRYVELSAKSYSVDAETERMMQGIIDSEFPDVTIIAVTHRFDFIHQYDRVIVLDGGVLMEDDTPAALLASESHFRKIYQAGGH
ncbi:ABC transporter [Thozetella sp. PMI_491]|nr:ABC transporter [Thozetella sp. PMI_491]